jgi:hypothetical protein
MAHPEMELVSESSVYLTSTFDPVYPSTEKMDAKGLDSKPEERSSIVFWQPFRKKTYQKHCLPTS